MATPTYTPSAQPGYEPERVQIKVHELIAMGVVVVFVGLAFLGTSIFWIYRKCMLPRRKTVEMVQQPDVQG